MKFFGLIAAPLILASSAVAQSYGWIAPAADATLSLSEPLNITLNTHRYFKESTNSVDIRLVWGAAVGASGNSYGVAQSVTGFTPNVQLDDGHGLITQGYATTLDVSSLRADTYSIIVYESYNTIGGVPANAYWIQTVHLE